jgi:hypothetical protein
MWGRVASIHFSIKDEAFAPKNHGSWPHHFAGSCSSNHSQPDGAALRSHLAPQCPSEPIASGHSPASLRMIAFLTERRNKRVSRDSQRLHSARLSALGRRSLQRWSATSQRFPRHFHNRSEAPRGRYRKKHDCKRGATHCHPRLSESPLHRPDEGSDTRKQVLSRYLSVKCNSCSGLDIIPCGMAELLRVAEAGGVVLERAHLVRAPSLSTASLHPRPWTTQTSSVAVGAAPQRPKTAVIRSGAADRGVLLPRTVGGGTARGGMSAADEAARGHRTGSGGGTPARLGVATTGGGATSKCTTATARPRGACVSGPRLHAAALSGTFPTLWTSTPLSPSFRLCRRKTCLRRTK